MVFEQAVAARPEVDRRRIVLMGLSFGAVILAPRAAVGRTDLAALIADPGLFSLLEATRLRLPKPFESALPDGG